MKRTILFLLGAAYSTCLLSQNLLPNPGFEDYTNLPASVGQYSYSTGWSNCDGGGSPDYCHINGSGSVTLPDCYFGQVSPYEGDAIMGMIVWHQGTPNFREYVSHALAEPLQVGQEYDVSFFITCGEENGNYGGYGMDKMSAAFTTGQPIQVGNDPIAGISPQFTYDSIFFNHEWQEVTFSFVATEAYDQITFGNFADDVDTGTQMFTSKDFPAAYYFIDQISVEAGSGTGITHLADRDVKVFPNPAHDVLNVDVSSFQSCELTIYDGSGSFVVTNNISGFETMSLELLDPGLYYLNISNKGRIIYSNKLVKQ